MLYVLMAVYAFKKSKRIREIFLQGLSVAKADKADLQVEAGALRHGGEGRDGRHSREGTHQHKDTPAVELVGRAHLETPAYMRRERGGVRADGSCNTQILCVKELPLLIL